MCGISTSSALDSRTICLSQHLKS